MDTRAALGAAAALAMTVTGGVSALFLTVGANAEAKPLETEPAATVEYVDQYGNPVSPPEAATAAGEGPESDSQTEPAEQGAQYGADGGEYEDPEHEDPEHEDADYEDPDYEDGDEHEDGEEDEDADYEDDDHQDGEEDEDADYEGEPHEDEAK